MSQQARNNPEAFKRDITGPVVDRTVCDESDLDEQTTVAPLDLAQFDGTTAARIGRARNWLLKIPAFGDSIGTEVSKAQISIAAKTLLEAGAEVYDLRDELRTLRARNAELVAALEAFSDAYEAQWGDLDVWLDFLEKANVTSRAALTKQEGRAEV